MKLARPLPRTPPAKATFETVELPERLIEAVGERSGCKAEGTVQFAATRQIRRVMDAIEESDIDLSEASSAEEIARLLAGTLAGRTRPRALPRSRR
jgi:hypothetical protein